MLTIRADQIEALERAKTERYARELARDLGDELPDRARGVDLERFVRDSIQAARRRGIGSEKTVGVFARLRLYLGADFETRPDGAWALAILTNDELDELSKINLLVREAARRYP